MATIRPAASLWISTAPRLLSGICLCVIIPIPYSIDMYMVLFGLKALITLIQNLSPDYFAITIPESM